MPFVKSMELSNGLKLDFYDISRKLAGDRWYVGLIARIDIQAFQVFLRQGRIAVIEFMLQAACQRHHRQESGAGQPRG